VGKFPAGQRGALSPPTLPCFLDTFAAILEVHPGSIEVGALGAPSVLPDISPTVEPGRLGANAELTNYIPTLQEQYGRFIAGDSPRGSFRRFLAQKLVGSDGLGEDGFSAADVTPVGAAFALDRAGVAALEGRYGDAVLEAAGIIPADRLAAPILRRTGQIAEPWVEKLKDFSKRSDELAGETLVHGVDSETLLYMGLRCVVDDDIPVAGGVYTAFMFKDKAILWNELPVSSEGGPLEFDRKPRQGHGGGVTEMVGRRHFVAHVPGTRFLDASTVGEFATDAELALAVNWDRTASSVKNMSFIALKTTEA